MGKGMLVRKAARLVMLAAPLALVGCSGENSFHPPSQPSPSFSLSTSQVTFTTDVKHVPKSQVVTANINNLGDSTLWFSADYQGEQLAQLSITNSSIANSAQGELQPVDPSTLSLGVHNGTIVVHACTNPSCGSTEVSGSPVNLAVTYTVLGLTTTTQSLAYSVNNTTAVAGTAQQVQVTGYPTADFTAGADASWLDLTRTAGATATTATLTATLDTAQLAVMGNGSYTATITLTPAAGAGDPITIPVTLAVARSEAQYVSPYIELPGSEAEVIVRGQSFSLLTVTGVHFGATPATAFRVVSDTEVRATHPALAAGSYAVTLDNAENLGHSTATLQVVAPPAFSAATLDYPAVSGGWTVHGLVYDTQRDAILVGLQYANPGDEPPGTAAAILRYAHNSGGWAAPLQSGAPSLWSLALSADGQQMLLGAQDLSIDQYDPVSLAPLNFINSNAAPGQYLNTMGVTNDDYVVGATAPGSNPSGDVVKYSIRNPAFVSGFDAGDSCCASGDSVASLDGSTVMMGGTQGTLSFSRYDASSGTVTSLGPSTLQGNAMATDRTGTHFVIQQQVITDASLNTLGTLPAQMLAVAMSADGNMVYALDAQQAGLLHVYSLVAGSSNTVTPTQTSQLTLAADPGAQPRLLLSRDERTLFVAGNSRVVVVPLGK